MYMTKIIEYAVCFGVVAAGDAQKEVWWVLVSRKFGACNKHQLVNFVRREPE
jgi:hypothetical protein